MSPLIFWIKRYRFYGLALLVAFIFINHFSANASPVKSASKGQPPATVSTMTVKLQSDSNALTAIGTVKASQSINVSSEVAGIVNKLNFDSGQAVQAGQMLAEFRDDDLKAQVNKDQATLNYDTKMYQRKKALLPMHYVAADEVDAALSSAQSDAAQLQKDQAILSQHTIIAPFTGTVGIRQVDLGEYVQAGQAIVNLESLTPAYIDFKVPEKWAYQIKINQPISLTTDSLPGKIINGKITATDLRIDEASRSLSVRAIVANTDHTLLSGMSVTVSIPKNQSNAIIIPQAALSYDPKGVSIFVIENNSAKQRYVETGERLDENIVIQKGLKVGDIIVTAGQQKLQDGMKVIVNNQLSIP